MAAQAAYPRVSIAEYLEGELIAEQKHELYQGWVYAMSGASKTHVLITPALNEVCRAALRGKTCRYLAQNAKVIVRQAGSAFYPDGLIACPPNFVDDRNGVIDNPTVIFEVLSPSTENHDRTTKFESYSLLESLQDYVLISTRKAQVEVFSRRSEGGWILQTYAMGSIAQIPSVGLTLPLDLLYEDVAFDVAPPLTFEPNS